MDPDPEIKKRQEGLTQVLKRLERLLGQTNSAVIELASDLPTERTLDKLDSLRGELAESLNEYLDKQPALVAYMRAQLEMIKEAKAETAMSEKPARSVPRDQARIEKLSGELTLNLRLQRVDDAIKELLDFLADTEFVAANAPTGRRRRLRALQNALEKALVSRALFER